jgi:hypothetical protein
MDDEHNHDDDQGQDDRAELINEMARELALLKQQLKETRQNAAAKSTNYTATNLGQFVKLLVPYNGISSASEWILDVEDKSKMLAISKEGILSVLKQVIEKSESKKVKFWFYAYEAELNRKRRENGADFETIWQAFCRDLCAYFNESAMRNHAIGQLATLKYEKDTDPAEFVASYAKLYRDANGVMSEYAVIEGVKLKLPVEMQIRLIGFVHATSAEFVAALQSIRAGLKSEVMIKAMSASAGSLLPSEQQLREFKDNRGNGYKGKKDNRNWNGKFNNGNGNNQNGNSGNHSNNKHNGDSREYRPYNNNYKGKHYDPYYQSKKQHNNSNDHQGNKNGSYNKWNNGNSYDKGNSSNSHNRGNQHQFMRQLQELLSQYSSNDEKRVVEYRKEKSNEK